MKNVLSILSCETRVAQYNFLTKRLFKFSHWSSDFSSLPWNFSIKQSEKTMSSSVKRRHFSSNCRQSVLIQTKTKQLRVIINNNNSTGQDVTKLSRFYLVRTTDRCPRWLAFPTLALALALANSRNAGQRVFLFLDFRSSRLTYLTNSFSRYNANFMVLPGA